MSIRLTALIHSEILFHLSKSLTISRAFSVNQCMPKLEKYILFNSGLHAVGYRGVKKVIKNKIYLLLSSLISTFIPTSKALYFKVYNV